MEWVFPHEAVAAAAVVSVVLQAGGQLQRLELLLLKAASPPDENVAVASWNRDQKDHPLQTDLDQEALNIAGRLQMVGLPGLHYTATDTEMARQYELPHLFSLKNTNSRIYIYKL
jgi:hypothetical protein